MTGVRGTTKKPYHREAACTRTNHVNKCTECETIENELNDGPAPALTVTANDDSETTPSDDRTESKQLESPLTAVTKGSSENVWQVSNIEKYDTFSKLNLSPITVLSSHDDSTLTTAESMINTGIDSSSFIVLKNDEHFFPNITTSGTSITSQNNLFHSKHSAAGDNHRPCYDCCFCNPTLHQRNDNSSPKTCNYCSTCHRSSRENVTAADNIRRQRSKNIKRLNNGTADRSATAATTTTTTTTERLYESHFRSDHKHTRTRSRDSGVISTNCTRRSNRKIREITPAPDDVINGNVAEPQQPVTEVNANKMQSKSSNLHAANGDGQTTTTTTTAGKKSSIPKLPPCEWSSNSYDTNTNPSTTSSSTSTNGSSPRLHRSRHGHQNSKSVPNLPTAERQSNASKVRKSSTTKSRTNSRFQHFYGNENACDREQAIVSAVDTKKVNNQQGKAVCFPVPPFCYRQFVFQSHVLLHIASFIIIITFVCLGRAVCQCDN